MAFRFEVIPAGSGDVSEGKLQSAVAEVLGALEGSPVGHYLVEYRSEAHGVLLDVDRPEFGFLESLLILAKDHGLAVYDIEISRLYDPAGGVDVDVLIPGVRIPFLTRNLLADLVLHPGWPDAEAPYLIVERADQDFIQAWLGDDGVYVVEYREGGPESHFRVRTDDAERVMNVMWAWVVRDESWRTAVDWMFVDLHLEEPPEEAAEVRVDRSIPPTLTFDDTEGAPILAYQPEEGGWFLHVLHYAPLSMGVEDFLAVDQAVAKAQRYLRIPLPAARKLVSKFVSLQNQHLEDGSWLNLDARLETDGALSIMGQDLGPVTQMMSDDGEYEWGYSFKPEDVPVLFTALGGLPGEDIIDVLERRFSGENAYRLGRALDASGVPHGFWSYP